MRAFVGLVIAVCVAIAIGVVIAWAAGPSTYGPSVARFTARFPGPVVARISTESGGRRHLPGFFGTGITQYEYSAGPSNDRLMVEAAVLRFPGMPARAIANFGFAGAESGTIRPTTFDGHRAEIGIACNRATAIDPSCSGTVAFTSGTLLPTKPLSSLNVTWFVTANAPTEDDVLGMILSVQPANS